jgi:hypothetical protein
MSRSPIVLAVMCVGYFLVLLDGDVAPPGIEPG